MEEVDEGSIVRLVIFLAIVVFKIDLDYHSWLIDWGTEYWSIDIKVEDVDEGVLE